MKRMLLMAVTSSVLALAAPGVASAHHAKHHGASHKRHAKRARVVTFGTAALTPASAPTQTSPTTPTPTTPTGETAGTVKSFEKGVLTITLKDGTAVSGMVTEETQLECQSATPSPTTGGDDQGAGDDQGGSEGGEHGASTAHAADHASQQGEGGSDHQGDGSGEGSQQSCTTAALVPNAVVGEAELKLSSAGAVWEKVQLLQ
jgi:hypothetical protein